MKAIEEWRLNFVRDMFALWGIEGKEFAILAIGAKK